VSKNDAHALLVVTSGVTDRWSCYGEKKEGDKKKVWECSSNQALRVPVIVMTRTEQKSGELHRGAPGACDNREQTE